MGVPIWVGRRELLGTGDLSSEYLSQRRRGRRGLFLWGKTFLKVFPKPPFKKLFGIGGGGGGRGGLWGTGYEVRLQRTVACLVRFPGFLPLASGIHPGLI